MRLKTYLQRNGLTHQAFADRIARPQSQVTRWLTAHYYPSLESRMRIQRATGGKVKAMRDWPRERPLPLVVLNTGEE